MKNYQILKRSFLRIYEKITTLIQELKTKGYHEDEASLMAFEQVHA